MMAAILGLWLVVLAAVPVLCQPWLSQRGLMALVTMEAALSLGLGVVRVRTRRAQQEKRQITAMRAAIERGIL